MVTQDTETTAGIERDENYVNVSRARIEEVCPDEFLSRKHSKPRQTSLEIGE